MRKMEEIKEILIGPFGDIFSEMFFKGFINKS